MCHSERLMCDSERITSHSERLSCHSKRLIGHFERPICHFERSEKSKNSRPQPSDFAFHGAERQGGVRL